MHCLTDTQWYAQARHFEWRGLHIAYMAAEAPDDKPVLVCIHGFPTSSWDWCKVWPGLQPHFRLIAMDLLGFGHSSKPKQHRYSLIEQAEMVEALLQHLRIADAHLLAHDYGDSVTQELLARQMEGRSSVDWQRITFLNGGLFPDAHRPRPIQRLLAGPLGPLLVHGLNQRTFAPSFAAVFGPDTQPTADELHAVWRVIARDDGQRLAHRVLQYIPERRVHAARWLQAMQRSAVPMQLINGNADPVSGRHLADRYRELIPDPLVIDLPRIGHYPQWEAPMEVSRAVLAFHA